jgi:hypothetical protein
MKTLLTIGFVLLTSTAMARSPDNPASGAGASASASSSSVAIGIGGSASAKQSQGQIQGQSQSARITTKQANQQSLSNSYSDEKQAPGFAAPSLTAFGGCKGSVSGGFSVAGFGAALGSTTDDADCRRLNNGTWLALQGHADAALALVCDNDGVRAALAKVGKSCPGDAKPTPVALAPAPSSPVVSSAPASGEKHPACSSSSWASAETRKALGC